MFCCREDDERAAYIPPEFCLPEGRVDPRSDIYSLGVALYELCCGQLPDREFSGTKDMAIELGVVIEKATYRDPRMRYKTAKEVKEALVDCLVRNEADGIHYGQGRDYDGKNSEEEVIRLLKTGRSEGLAL